MLARSEAQEMTTHAGGAGGAAQRRQKKVAGGVDKQALYRGADLERIIEAMRTKVDDEARRLIAKGRAVPDIRLREYIDLQAAQPVREALSALISRRSWRYVSFAEFMEALRVLARRLADEVPHLGGRGGDRSGGAEQPSATAGNAAAPAAACTCFVVDSLQKSSFWVVSMLLSMMLPGVEYTDALALAVDGDGTNGGLYAAFRQLPRSTHLVLVDDATFSGEQMSYFHDTTTRLWRETHGTAARVHLAVPYMSLPSLCLFHKRAGTRLLHHETFNTLFYRRPLASVLLADLFLVRTSLLMTEYQSLFFDFLGLLPTNTLFIFEHKVADALSIPNRWLKTGPCVPPHLTKAYRLRPDRIRELIEECRIEFNTGWRSAAMFGAGTPTQRELLAITRRVTELLHSPRFRSQFAERVPLAPSPADRVGGATPPFFPLLPIDFCDAGYRRYVRTRLSKLGAVDEGTGAPPCRRPPYKRTSYRRRLPPGAASGRASSFRD